MKTIKRVVKKFNRWNKVPMNASDETILETVLLIFLIIVTLGGIFN